MESRRSLFISVIANRRIDRRIAGALVLHTCIVLLAATACYPATMTAQNAKEAVSGWLTQPSEPLGAKLGKPVDHIETCLDDKGGALYHVVHLNPSGFIITSADDEIEPIIAFSENGRYEKDPDNPLFALLNRDLKVRHASLGRKTLRKANGDSPKDRWELFKACSPEAAHRKDSQASSLEAKTLEYVSDIWAPILVQSEWSQRDVAGMPCYNYYTPSNMPAGCVAIAMAQVMRYHRDPTSGIGIIHRQITVDGTPVDAYTRGGNGSGGPYYWDSMPLIPNASTPEAERQAIGALCYDAGVLVQMDYTAHGSGASMNDAARVLRDEFQYRQSVYADLAGIDPEHYKFKRMVIPNVVAGYPVIMAWPEHAFIADGYGYNGPVPYYHLNMGWDGDGNLWYNLPDDLFPNVIYSCIYNINPRGTWEMVCGKVTDSSGFPVEGLEVTLGREIGVIIGSTYQTVLTADDSATTNSAGIYAFDNVVPHTTYVVYIRDEHCSSATQQEISCPSSDGTTVGNYEV